MFISITSRDAHLTAKLSNILFLTDIKIRLDVFTKDLFLNKSGGFSSFVVLQIYCNNLFLNLSMTFRTAYPKYFLDGKCYRTSLDKSAS